MEGSGGADIVPVNLVMSLPSTSPLPSSPGGALNANSGNNNHQPVTLKPFIKGERRYPCGFPGCKWIFTRSNHVLRHHQRVHPGYNPQFKVSSINVSHPGTNTSTPLTMTTGTNGSATTTSTSTSTSVTNPSNNNNQSMPNLVKHVKPKGSPRSLLGVLGGGPPPFTGGSNGGVRPNVKHQRILPNSLLNDRQQKQHQRPPTQPLQQDESQLQQQQALLLAHLLAALQQQIGGANLSPLEQQILLTSLLNSGASTSDLLNLPPPQVKNGPKKRPHQDRLVSGSSIHSVVSSSSSSGVIVEDSDSDDVVNLSMKAATAAGGPSIRKKVKTSQSTNAVQVVEEFLRGSSLPPAPQPPQPLMTQVDDEDQDEQDDDNDSFPMTPPLEPLEPEVVLEVDDSHVWDPEVQDIVTSPTTTANPSSHFPFKSPPETHHPPTSGVDRPYVCDYPGCRWSFKRQYHLDRHLLTHRVNGQNGPNGEKANGGQIKRTFQSMEEMLAADDDDTSGDEVTLSITPKLPTLSPIVRKTSASSMPTSTVTSVGRPQPQPLPATSTVQGPIKGSFTCNYPGCGIKCQSQSSFEAHVYLTHIVMNANRNKDGRGRGNGGSNASQMANGKKSVMNQQNFANNSLINSPFYLELQSKMKAKMMEQKKNQQQQLNLNRHQLPQQKKRTQEVVNSTSESESERVSSSTSINLESTTTGALANLVSSKNGQEGRQGTTDDQSLSFLATILSAVSRQQTSQRNAMSEEESRLGHVPSHLERVLSSSKPNKNPTMATMTEPSATNNNHNSSSTQVSIVKCPPGRTSSESLSFLASLAAAQQQQQNQGKSSPTTTLQQQLSFFDGHSNDGAQVEKALFACDIPGCDKKFGRNCELTRHKLNHMDVWPFSCDHPGCGRRFKRKDVFKNHLRTHVKDSTSTTTTSNPPSISSSSLSSPVS